MPRALTLAFWTLGSASPSPDAKRPESVPNCGLRCMPSVSVISPRRRNAISRASALASDAAWAMNWKSSGQPAPAAAPSESASASALQMAATSATTPSRTGRLASAVSMPRSSALRAFRAAPSNLPRWPPIRLRRTITVTCRTLSPWLSRALITSTIAGTHCGFFSIGFNAASAWRIMFVSGWVRADRYVAIWAASDERAIFSLSLVSIPFP
mmetsp:Transcript_32547/g.77717  ORF Transcript_32547/g.77717 Transcript_32547/m.77717 type:complete len:212 (-) Transcript_32547:51-686(-)